MLTMEKKFKNTIANVTTPKSSGQIKRAKTAVVTMEQTIPLYLAIAVYQTPARKTFFLKNELNTDKPLGHISNSQTSPHDRLHFLTDEISRGVSQRPSRRFDACRTVRAIHVSTEHPNPQIFGHILQKSKQSIQKPGII